MEICDCPCHPVKPNAETVAAMEEVLRGETIRVKSVKDLFTDLD
jgi:hypothetical protein